MKKNLFFLAVGGALFALASCSNDETVAENNAVNQPKEIAFTPVSQKATRAVVDGTTFQDADDFDVVAYLADGGSAAGDYFASTNFKKNYRGGSASGASDGLWAGTTARYWPLSASHINFLAVTSTSGNGVTSKVSTTFGNEGSNFASKAVITLTGNNGYQQADLMYAAGQGKVTQTSGSNSLTFNNTEGKVEMEFQHALAWIDFKVKTATTDENVEIKVNSITLNGAHYNGTYTINNNGSGKGYDGDDFTIGYNTTADNTTATNWRNLVGVWSGSSAVATQIVPKADYSDAAAEQSAALTATAAQFGGGLLVIPDGSAADDNGYNASTGFTMNYSIKMGDVTNTYDYTYTFSNTEKTWKQRKHYTYIINITLHEILVEPTVQDWSDESDTTVEVPGT